MILFLEQAKSSKPHPLPPPREGTYGHTECFGTDATDHLTALLSGQKINLLYDATQGTKDKYGRTLAYLIGEDKTDYNRQMIADGYAYEYTYKTKYKRQGIYKQAQKTAMKNKNGLRKNGSCKLKNETTSSNSAVETGSATPDAQALPSQPEASTPAKPAIPTTIPQHKVYHRGPKGGCYYYNSNGKKEYVDKSFCI